MSKKFSHNDTKTTTSTLTKVPQLDFANDYGIRSLSDKAVVYNYVKGNTDQPHSIRFAIDDVKNVYTNAEVQPGNYALNKKGKSLLIGVRDTARVEDANGVLTDFPISCNISIKYPISASVTSDEVKDTVGRALAAMITASAAMEQEDTPANIASLDRLLRGVLVAA